MCTVSWIHQDGGYQLLCNRDERHARKPALPPRIFERGGARFIAPIDGDHGGSWIGVNQFGLSLCLLNRYQNGEQSTTESKFSRGLVLLELMDSVAQADVHNRILEKDLSRHQPFTLVVLEPGKQALLVDWTGRECLSEPDGEQVMPVTSSSYDPVGVGETRRHTYERLINRSARSADLLFEFHSSHEPGPGPYSTCMHRDDARTVSFCWIKVTEDRIGCCYYPHSPCSFWPDADRASTGLTISRTLR